MSDTASTPLLHTVTGLIAPESAGIVDGHTHVWIDPVGSVDPDAPVLTDAPLIARGLAAFRAAGGATLIDCQPGGCGRNGNRLFEFSRASGVAIVAATGFHLRRYYPASAALFSLSAQDASRHFVDELTRSLDETRASASPVRAGFIKIACEATLEATPQHLVEAAVLASRATGSAVEVHTERGSDAERIAGFMLDAGMLPEKLILCHTDKRPDFGLHAYLAQMGIALEYDTFFRPKYHPDEHLWALLEHMIDVGFEDSIVAATDMADVAMWRQPDLGAGPAGLINHIIPRMEAIGFSPLTIRKLTGLNVARRLARLAQESTA
ncbi:MAG: hypothetical protein U0703_23460 [Anaerolineae bacterium]